MNKFSKKVLVLRQLLIGARYFNALAAMDFAAKHHVKLRKDGVTPEFDHQVSIALYALTLADVLFREELLTTIFLHDVSEDYDISSEEIGALFSDKEFASRVTTAVDLVTKVWRGEKKNTKILFVAMAGNPIASIAKGCDRIHNLQTMVGVFNVPKQIEYVAETRDDIIPMLKAARGNFRHQGLAYENIKWMMNSQIQLIEAMHSNLT